MRRKAPEPSKGWRSSTPPLDGKPPRKLQAFKVGQVIPHGAEYLTFAIKDDTPHFFFMVPRKTKRENGRTIGFRLS